MTGRLRRFPRPHAVIAGLALVALLTVGLLQVPAPSAEPGQREIAREALLWSSHWDRLARGKSASGDDTAFTVTGTPLGPGGQEITVPQASALLAICMDCLLLPPQGPMSAANGSEAWTRASDRAVALQYADGVVFYVSPSPDSDRQRWIDSWTTDIAAGGWPGRMIDLRGTRAPAADSDTSGPASVSWMEASHLYEIYGDGGQSLDDLAQRAESLVSRSTMTAQERWRLLHLVGNVLRRGDETEHCPEALRVPLDQAIRRSTFPAWFPSHQLASRENLAGVCPEGGVTIAFLFRSARPPDDPLWFDGISIWEGRWGGGDPLTVYKENMAAFPEDTGKRIHTVRGVPAQSDAAHDSMAGDDAAYLELVLGDVSIQLSGGESVEDLMAIAETLHQLSS
jgi:hypothetical protein